MALKKKGLKYSRHHAETVVEHKTKETSVDPITTGILAFFLTMTVEAVRLEKENAVLKEKSEISKTVENETTEKEKSI